MWKNQWPALSPDEGKTWTRSPKTGPLIQPARKCGASGLMTAITPLFVIRLPGTRTAIRLPAGFIGLILSGMISAAICSLSADLNLLAAVGVEDYYKKAKPGKTDKEYLRASKAIVILSGVISILISLLYINAGDEGVLGILFTLYAIFSGGVTDAPAFSVELLIGFILETVLVAVLSIGLYEALYFYARYLRSEKEKEQGKVQ